MDDNRKKELSNHAQAYSEEFSDKNGLPDFEKISASENIVIIYDNYNKSFEGLTVCENGRFFIHIDIDSFTNINSKRARFTIAHELGHALIDEHRIGLLTKELEPHISEYLLGGQKKEIELEADYFASCLLMPHSFFLSTCNRFEDGFSFHLFSYLNEYFKTSYLATVLRYAEVGPKAVFFTFNREGQIKWYKKGSKFPDWAFKFKVHGNVPKNTIIHDVFNKGKESIGEIREVDRDDWFYVSSDEYGVYELYEQCFYLKSYDLIVSMLWFEKVVINLP